MAGWRGGGVVGWPSGRVGFRRVAVADWWGRWFQHIVQKIGYLSMTHSTSETLGEVIVHNALRTLMDRRWTGLGVQGNLDQAGALFR